MLQMRLARGEISPDEYRAAEDAIGGASVTSAGALIALAIGLVVVGLVGGIIAAVGVGSMGGGMMGDVGSMMGSGSPGRSGAAPVPGARQVRVVAREFSFEPVELHLRVGQTVNVRFDDEGRLFHTFTVSALHFELRTDPGQAVAGSLRPDKAGRYQFICSVPGHAAAGMRGIIVVTG